MVYGNNKNKFTDHKGRSEIYLFNNAGNTVSVQNDAGNAQSYKFITEGMNKNKLSQASKLQATAAQLFKNPNITSAQHWTPHTTENTSATFHTSTENARFGKTSLKLYSNSDSCNVTFSQAVTLVKGKSYVFSAYVRAADHLITGRKCFLQIRIRNSAGALQYVASFDAVPCGNEWYRMEFPYTLPTDAGSAIADFYVGLIRAKGMAYYDCIQLEEGTIASRYNLIENNDFRDGATAFARASTMNMFDGVISLDSADTAPKTIITVGSISGSGAVNVRSGPGTNYPVLTSVTPGKHASIVASASDPSGTV